MISYPTEARDYQTSLIATPPHDFAGKQTFGAKWPEMTDFDYHVALMGDTIISETAFVPFKGMSISAPTPSPAYKLIKQLATLQSMSEDERWPTAIWPSLQAFKDAQVFIRRLMLSVIPLPKISLADDGEVNFFWDNGSVHVDLEFYGTGTCSYFARGKDGQRIHGDDVPASDGLPTEIAALFTA